MKGITTLGFLVLALEARGLGTPAFGQVFNNTGANQCTVATVIPVPVGPVGSPLTVTIFGDNSPATGPDCAPPPGRHVGPTWWEAFNITERAKITIDMCGTVPVQDPSYDVIYRGCAIPSQPCSAPVFSQTSGRGLPFCADGNMWSTYVHLDPGTYRIPILSDPAVVAVGPYEMHIHASQCQDSCCRTNEQGCEDCVDPAMCAGPGDVLHPGESCFDARCFSIDGPDLVVGAVWECEQLGREGPIGSGTVAMSCHTTVCNKGNARGNWDSLPETDHPVIGVNLYRMETVAGTTRFEQLGQSWLKHTNASANADECGFGCVFGADFDEIGIGCSDTYHAIQFFDCGLGPRSMINPYTGAMPGGPELGSSFNCEPLAFDRSYPSSDHRDHVHTPISHKTQIQEVDLDPVAHPGARYFAEGFYIMPHEFTAGNGNQNNNYSHVEVAVSGPDIDGVYQYALTGLVEAESPALDAWTGSLQSMIEPAPLVDGRAFLAWQATNLGGGQWHYEYALYNMNLDRSIGSLCVPLAPGVTVSNVGFHAPRNHDPEPHTDNYSNDPWIPTVTADAIRWDTERVGTNPFANAVRFGTLYNFRFDASVAPQTVNGAAGLFKTNGTVAVALQGPSPAAPTDANGNGVPDVCESAAPPQLLSDPSGINKTRFLSFSIPSSAVASAGETALRVRLVSLHHVVPPYTGGPSVPFTSSEGQVRWVGPPTQYVESGASAVPFYAASFQCSPHYQDWSTVGLLHVTGSAITPSSTFEIENVAAVCMGAEANCAAVSAPLSIATTRWGDVRTPYNPPDPSVQPDISDVSALVDKFRNAPGAPIKARGILAGAPGNPFGEITHEVLNVDFGFGHISACVDAFRGAPYPYTISECP